MAEIKVIEIDSTYRDRNVFENPCNFLVEINKPDKETALEAYDPVSTAAPLATWTGNTLDALLPNVTNAVGVVVSIAVPNVIVSFGGLIPFTQANFYRGLTVNNVTVTEYTYLGVNAGLHYMSFKLSPFPAALVIGGPFPLDYYTHPLPINVPGNVIRLFVPAYYTNTSKIVYNETLDSYVTISKKEDSFVTFTAAYNTWQYNHQFSLREDPPSYVTSFVALLAPDNVRVAATSQAGTILYIPSINYFGKILTRSAISYIVTPHVSGVIAPGAAVQTLDFSYDNKHSLRYLGSPNQQEKTWYVSIVDVQIPNRKIKNGTSLTEYSVLYLELRDQRYSPYDILMSNNPNCNQSLFRLSSDTSNATQNFLTYTTNSNHYKTFRFTPNLSTFVVRLLTPNGDLVQFEEDDNIGPLKPKAHLQINIAFVTSARKE